MKDNIFDRDLVKMFDGVMFSGQILKVLRNIKLNKNLQKYIIPNIPKQKKKQLYQRISQDLFEEPYISAYHLITQQQNLSEIYSDIKIDELERKIKAEIERLRILKDEDTKDIYDLSKKFFDKEVFESFMKLYNNNKEKKDDDNKKNDEFEKQNQEVHNERSTEIIIELKKSLNQIRGRINDSIEKNTTKKVRKGKKKTTISSKLIEVFKANIEEWSKSKFSVKQMYEALKKELRSELNIKKTTFYTRVLKKMGYRYIYCKFRFGNQQTQRRIAVRRVTTCLIADMFLRGRKLYFLDECTFSTSDFHKKNWIKKDEEHIRQVFHPMTTLKLLSLTDKDGVVCFILSQKSFKSSCIFEFVTRFLEREEIKCLKNERIYLVLDNSPKNRSEEMKSVGRSKYITLMYITPGTPDQNMIENYFSRIKKSFSTMKILETLNDKLATKNTIFFTVLKAMIEPINQNFQPVQRMFLGGLINLLKRTKKFV